MLVLAIDTSGPFASAALHDGQRVLAHATSDRSMAHGEHLAPLMASALETAGAQMSDITQVVAGVGPGPFTGLRVGVVTALTVADALGVPGRGVCSLDAIAFGAVAAGIQGEFIAASDARRKEVYWARYVDETRLEGPGVDKPAALAARFDHLPVVGRGQQLYPDVLSGPRDIADVPTDATAADLVRSVIADSVELLPLEPLYLRRPDAVEPGAPKLA